MRRKELAEISILQDNHPNVCLPWTFLVCFSLPAIIKMNALLVDRAANGEGGRIPQDIVLETLLQSAKNPENTYLYIFFIAWNAVGRFTFCPNKTETKMKLTLFYQIVAKSSSRGLIQFQQVEAESSQRPENNREAWTPCCSNSNPRAR